MQYLIKRILFVISLSSFNKYHTSGAILQISKALREF